MLRQQITDAMKEAMKARDERTLSSVRLIMAALKSKDIDARPSGNTDGIPDDQILSMMQAMIKQRRDSIALYHQGNRQDLVDKEEAEIRVIERFLPKQMTDEEMRNRTLLLTGSPPSEEQLAPASGPQILERMTRNLFGVAQDEEDLEGMNRYVETLLTINPDSADHHVKRALIRFQKREYAAALEDVDWLQQSASPEIDQDRVLQLRSLIERGLRESAN